MVINTYFKTRYAETDQMGIIHHANYPIWFEMGRTEFFAKLEIKNSRLEAEGLLLPLAGVECHFKNPARYEDEILLRTRIVKLSCVRIKFAYEVYNQATQKLLATGSTTHAWTGKNLRPLNIKKKFPQIYQLLETQIESNG